MWTKMNQETLPIKFIFTVIFSNKKTLIQFMFVIFVSVGAQQLKTEYKTEFV